MKNDDNKHKMTTRSKRKNDTENIDLEVVDEKKRKVIDSDNYLTDSSSSDSDIEDDIDEHGNIKDLIDYDYEEELDEDNDYIQEEDIDDEELLIGKLLSRYINEKMDNDERKENEKYEEILSKYDRPMRKYFFELDESKKEEILLMENDIKSVNHSVIPLRFQLLTSNLDTNIKAIAMRKIEALSQMDPSSNEYHKTKN